MTMTTTTAVEGRVDHVVLPVTLGLRSGTMRLADGRLRYTRRFRRRVVFDAPVGEFHSFARSSMGTGFHLWHGTARHRFIVYHPVVPATVGTGLAADLAEGVSTVRQSLVAHARSQREVASWEDVLVPVIAPQPPPGVRVRPPYSRRRYVLAALAFALTTTLLITAAITAVVFATA
jgi:hypothetical protein